MTDPLRDVLAASSPGAALAARGDAAPWRALANTFDEAIRRLAGAVPGGTATVAATAAYGRMELTRRVAPTVVIVASSGAEHVVHAVLSPFWEAGIPVAHRVVTPGAPLTRDDALPELLELLDARLVCGDAAAFAALIATRRVLVMRRRRALEVAVRAAASTIHGSATWQRSEPDLMHDRGGLRLGTLLRHRDAITSIVAGDHGASSADPNRPLAGAISTLLRALWVAHSVEGAEDDRLRSGDVGAAAAGDGLARDTLMAMRAVDAAADAWLRAAPSTGVAGLGRLVGRMFGGAPPRPPEAPLDALLDILRAVPALLDPLPPSDALSRLLPEWEAIRALPRAGAPYPVDTHAIRTVQEACRLIGEEDEAAALAAEELSEHDDLLLAALLHDVGQGHEQESLQASVVIAERFSARAGLPPERVRRVVTAVEQHQLLSTASARRDLADERVIFEIAEAVGDPETLHLLYLLALADAQAMATEPLGEWRAGQLRTLYVRVLSHMTEPDAAGRPMSEVRRAATVQSLADRYGAIAVSRHLDALPSRYVLAMVPATIGDHLDLIAEADGGTAVRLDPVGQLWRVTVVTSDRPGVLSLVAGALAQHGLNVLGGSVYTREDGVALDVLHVGASDSVSSIAPESVRSAVMDAVEGRTDLSARFQRRLRSSTAVSAATAILVNNTDSEQYSIVEVRTADRPWLLYAITHELADAGLDIHLAKVDTVGHEVIDAFYVLRANGRRLEDADEVLRLNERLRDAIGALDR